MHQFYYLILIVEKTEDTQRIILKSKIIHNEYFLYDGMNVYSKLARRSILQLLFILSQKGYINLFENCKLIHDTRRYVIVIKVTLYSSQIFPYISLRILAEVENFTPFSISTIRFLIFAKNSMYKIWLHWKQTLL